MRRVYLAGPMTGIPGHNFPAFNAAAAKLRADGHFVFNPAEVELGGFETTKEFKEEGSCPRDVYRNAMAEDVRFICLEADAIAMLPGWENSKGARAEWHLSLALGHEVIYL
jgi:hypothetical protein